MTDKQIRNRIVGALSVSMMPMEMEAECIQFLDRCLEQISWHSAKQLPPMHTECFEDDDDTVEYQISDPVLVYTEDEEMVAVRATVEFGTVRWFDIDGSEYNVTHWRKLPEESKEVANGQ